MSNTDSRSDCKSKNKDLKRILFSHINKNMIAKNLKISQEMEAPSLSKVENSAHVMPISEVQKLGKDFRRIKVKHKKLGIMRRNKLLLEHIMHERIKEKEIFQDENSSYQTNISLMA